MDAQRKTQEALEKAPEQVAQEAGGRVKDVAGELQQTLRGELTTVVREAAIEVLTPVARKATTSAAKYAVTKGPEIVKDVVVPRMQKAGGPAALAKAVTSAATSKVGGAGQLLSKVRPGRRGGADRAGASGTGRGRRLPVQEYIDIAVPVETAYDQWTQFEEFPKFMRGVEQIEQRDDTTLVWHEKLWGVRRSWVAEITDQRPNERIAWRSTSGPKNVGVVTFHRLSDRLTRVQVNLDHEPEGLFEKTASGLRYTRRGLESDLKRFKALIEMSDEATGAWRGRVEEGEVVEQPEQAAEEPEAAEAAEEPEEGEEPEEPEEPEEAQAPSRRRRRRPRDEYEEYDEEEDTEEADEEPEEEEEVAEERPRPRQRRERTARRA
jgi:uncharacterized membrane protein